MIEWHISCNPNSVDAVYCGQFTLQKCKNQAKSHEDQPYMRRILTLETKIGYSHSVIRRDISRNYGLLSRWVVDLTVSLQGLKDWETSCVDLNGSEQGYHLL